MDYFNGGPIDDSYAANRSLNEPLVEITQAKGTSETHPLISKNDEWASFETATPYDSGKAIEMKNIKGAYVRNAYLRGLEIEEEGTINPYKFGLIGSSDTHTGAGSFDENNYWSKVGILDGTAQGRGSVPLTDERIAQLTQYSAAYNQPPSTQELEGRTYADTGFEQWGASGLAVAWAEENTRESIFSSFRSYFFFLSHSVRFLL